jgi:segregation and condensation protein B
MDELHIRNIIEAALLTAGEPVSTPKLAKLFEPPLEAELATKPSTSSRGAGPTGASSSCRSPRAGDSGQAVRTVYLDRLAPEKPPRYSRAVMETWHHRLSATRDLR